MQNRGVSDIIDILIGELSALVVFELTQLVQEAMGDIANRKDMLAGLARAELNGERQYRDHLDVDVSKFTVLTRQLTLLEQVLVFKRAMNLVELNLSADTLG